MTTDPSFMNPDAYVAAVWRLLAQHAAPARLPGDRLLGLLGRPQVPGKRIRCLCAARRGPTS